MNGQPYEVTVGCYSSKDVNVASTPDQLVSSASNYAAQWRGSFTISTAGKLVLPRS